eukprot:COSAG06_NODE_1164_length_10454_cov_5.699179_4_plen_665_part_00
MSTSAAELLFNALDADGNGVITRSEMRDGLAAHGSPSGVGGGGDSSPPQSVFTVAARTRALAQMAESGRAPSVERTPPTRVSPTRGGDGGSGSGGGGLSYEPAFVEALQAQQRARLEETLSAAERLLSAKEDELGELTAKSKTAASAASAREQELQRQLDEATGKLAKLETETDSRRRKQEHSFASELAELKAIRAEELSHLRRQHETETDELRTSCQEQIATIEANRRAVVDQLSRQQRDESHTADKARDLAAMYELQVQQLEQMLNDESQRLAEVRDELCSVTMAGSNEVLKERAEAAELRRKLIDTEEELVKRQGAHEEAVEMARQQHAQSVKQGELKAALALAEEEWRAELRRKDKECGRLRRKVQELIEAGSSQQAQHDAEMQQVRSDVLRMKESHSTTVKFSRQQADQNKDLMRMSRQLQREVGISSNEVKLLENETRRLRDDNAELRREVARLDNIIYGRKGNMASGRRAANAANAAAAVSTPRRGGGGGEGGGGGSSSSRRRSSRSASARRATKGRASPSPGGGGGSGNISSSVRSRTPKAKVRADYVDSSAAAAAAAAGLGSGTGSAQRRRRREHSQSPQRTTYAWADENDDEDDDGEQSMSRLAMSMMGTTISSSNGRTSRARHAMYSDDGGSGGGEQEEENYHPSNDNDAGTL